MCGLDSVNGHRFFKLAFVKHTTHMNKLNSQDATSVQIFSHDQFGQLRTIEQDKDKVWFCLSDVCQSLGLGNASQTKSRLKEKGITINDTLTPGGIQQLIFIDEPNLYRCVFQSRKPEAESFQDWVVEEILPSIRKSGGYIKALPEETPEQIMAKALIVAQKTIESHKQKLQMLEGEVDVLQAEKKVLAPKAIYTDEVLQSTSTFTLTQVAHDLGFRSVYAFTAWAKEKGLLFYQSGQWQPTAHVSGKGYFATRTARFIKSDNTIGTSLSTVVTEKGRMFLHGLRKWGVA